MNANAPDPEFDAIRLAKSLLRGIGTGTLATLEADGAGPFASLVTVATDLDGSPLLLLSGLSAHTGNLDADPRASLLLALTGKGDPLAHPRLTLTGLVEPFPEPRAKRRFLARHPKAALYADFPDFTVRRFAIARAHLNGGFARAARLEAAAIATDLGDAAGLIEAEERAVAHMNQDHADALSLYATRLAGAEPGPWRASGVDPDGIDLLAGDRSARVPFPERATDGPSLRRILVRLADEASRVNE